ncbi:MAG TPA: hypothetical protein VFH11_09555 [Gemmatimonadota bacterium]|nr:hypothetical protein [Gemmatimonadota bacterium]
MAVLIPHHARANPILHVTNGDCAAERIARADLGGEILPWRDVLHEGPVPAGLTDAELRDRRAEFLGGREPSVVGQVLRDLEWRDARLAVSPRDEIVLWFEPDLYDQLQILQILERLSREDHAGTRITAVESVERMGDLDPSDVRELYVARSPLPAGALELAALAWERFRDPDPTGLEDLAARPTPELPHLRDAVHRYLEELPATRDGLSRSERQLLEALAGGPLQAREAFVAAHHARERLVFLGDTVFFDYLERLAAGARPLVSLSRRPADAAMASLTEDGRRVLDGKLDWIDLGGSDRWLGGVHLAGRDAAWRWDPDERRVRRGR